VYVLVTELTQEQVQPMAAGTSSVFPVGDMTDPGGSLEDFLSDMSSWEFDFPAEIPPAVQSQLEAGVGGKMAERPLPMYENKMMSSKQQPPEQQYQVAGSWPQLPPQITQHVRPSSSHAGNGRMHPMSAGLSPHQQYNGMLQGVAGLTHSSVEMSNNMPPSQPCARQTVVPYGNMQPCQQRDVQGPPQYLQHRPSMMSNHAMQSSQVRTMSPGLQHSMMPNQSAMMHAAVPAAPMSNQLHNLQVMVNNQTSMMHRSHINMSPGLGPNGSGDLSDPLMQGKMHRNSARMMRGGHHNGVSNEARVFHSSEYLQQPNVMRQSPAQLQNQSVNMAHPAAAGFHNQSSMPPLQRGMMHGQVGPVVQQNHSMTNHSGIMANHPSMMPTQPELRPNHFSGRSHGMGVMSPVHRGMVHSSGTTRSQVGIPSQQMMMLKQQQQQPVQMQHADRNAVLQQSQAISDKNGAAFQWLSPCSTPNMMTPPAGVQNVTQARNSPAVNQFPPTVSPAAGTVGGRGGQSNASFTADIDSLSFLSDPFLSQVTDNGYCHQQQMMQQTSTAGIKHIVECI